MLKIFINEREIILASRNFDSSGFQETNPKYLITPYNGPKRHFFHYIDTLEKANGRTEGFLLLCENPENALIDLCSLLNVNVAAGGIVLNSENKILSIFRRDFWDLPKGKVDPGEALTQTAIREVQEETGVLDLKIERYLVQSFHIFRNNKNERILKHTHWYLMRTNHTQRLIPQVEEDIDQAIWLSPNDLYNKLPLYKNIQHLLEFTFPELKLNPTNTL
jgi:8-oxo-dGTP pyrophosphatase MutT (NUDIX family)